MSVPSPSHHIWNSVIINSLAERGHNITVLSSDLPKNLNEIPKNIYYIHLEKIYEILSEISNSSNFFMRFTTIFNDIFMFYEFATFGNKGIVKSKGFHQLLNYPDNFKFDLIIYDFTIGGLLVGFIHKFHYPPLIGVTAFPIPSISIDYIGGHLYPGYIPFFSLNYDMDMNIWQRIHNTFLYAFEAVYRRFFYIPKIDTLMRKYFSDDTPYLGDLQERMTLALVNSHPSINYPQPLPPNIIEIGGVQILDPKPLEKDIEQFINTSKKGAILFSLGTNIRSEDLGLHIINGILKMMEEFSDYHFLWKFDKKSIKNEISSNVMMRNFFHQRDILAHPKLKLFITHAGGLSTQEAIWRAVPMVGIPFFADQHRNLHKSISMGIAVQVDFNEFTVKNLKNAIQEVLKNETYSKNVKIISESFRDRPMKPLDTTLWWIEYIIRHPNPQHLKSPVIKFGMFTTNNYDILFVLILFIICLCLISFKIFKILYFKKFNKKNSIDENKKCN